MLSIMQNKTIEKSTAMHQTKLRINATGKHKTTNNLSTL